MPSEPSRRGFIVVLVTKPFLLITFLDRGGIFIRFLDLFAFIVGIIPSDVRGRILSRKSLSLGQEVLALAAALWAFAIVLEAEAIVISPGPQAIVAHLRAYVVAAPWDFGQTILPPIG
jgi:hypothetical protein